MKPMSSMSNYQLATDSVIQLAANKPLNEQQRLGINYFALLGMMAQRLSEADTELKHELNILCDKAGAAAEGLTYA